MTASAPGSTVMRAVSKPGCRVAAALALCCTLAPGAGIAAAPACDQAGKSAAPGRSGAATLFALGCHDAALQHTQTLIDAAVRDTPAQQKDLALALNDAAVISEKLGRYTVALAFYRRSLPLLEGGQDDALTATLTVNLAALHYRMGAYAEAARTYEDADPARPWAHPYFWAPFTLSGDWL